MRLTSAAALILAFFCTNVLSQEWKRCAAPTEPLIKEVDSMFTEMSSAIPTVPKDVANYFDVASGASLRGGDTAMFSELKKRPYYFEWLIHNELSLDIPLVQLLTDTASTPMMSHRFPGIPQERIYLATSILRRLDILKSLIDDYVHRQESAGGAASSSQSNELFQSFERSLVDLRLTIIVDCELERVTTEVKPVLRTTP